MVSSKQLNGHGIFSVPQVASLYPPLIAGVLGHRHRTGFPGLHKASVKLS